MNWVLAFGIGVVVGAVFGLMLAALIMAGNRGGDDR